MENSIEHTFVYEMV